MDINHTQLLRQWPVGRDTHHHQRVRTGISSRILDHKMENQQKRLDFIGQIVGKYSLVEQVNYEEYLKAIGELLLHHQNMFNYSMLIIQ